MTQLGHIDPKFALKVYAQTWPSATTSAPALEALVNGPAWRTLSR
jgi:hypothetical protein